MLDSITYHYEFKPEGHWPEELQRQYGVQVFKPDYVSFDMHVTVKTCKITVQSIRVGGPRVLKHGLSEHRILDHYYAHRELPEFIRRYVDEVLRELRIVYPRITVRDEG